MDLIGIDVKGSPEVTLTYNYRKQGPAYSLGEQGKRQGSQSLEAWTKVTIEEGSDFSGKVMTPLLLGLSFQCDFATSPTERWPLCSLPLN